MAEMFGIIMRETPENHDTTAPQCDERCQRWGDHPHAHICPDGLHDDTPFMTVSSWCSCGANISPPLRLDFSAPEVDTLVHGYNAGAVRMMVLHMQTEHGIDITTDEDWQRRLETAP